MAAGHHVSAVGVRLSLCHRFRASVRGLGSSGGIVRRLVHALVHVTAHLLVKRCRIQEVPKSEKLVPKPVQGLQFPLGNVLGIFYWCIDAASLFFTQERLIQKSSRVLMGCDFGVVVICPSMDLEAEAEG